MLRREPRYVSLTLGVIFLLLGVGYLVGHGRDWNIDAGWLLAVGLLAVGAAGVASVTSWFRRRDE